jgi:hypothetical protein
VKAEAAGKFLKMAADKKRPVTSQYRPDGYSHGQQKRVTRKIDDFDKIRPEKDGNQGNQENDSDDNPAGEGYPHLNFPERRGGGFLLPDLEHYRFLKTRGGRKKIVPQNIPRKFESFNFLGALGTEKAVQFEPQPEAKGETFIPDIFVQRIQ